MQLWTLAYEKRKLKLMFYMFAGIILLIILLIAALTGQLVSNRCETNMTTQINDQGMDQNAKSIYAHWLEKYHASPQAAAGILGVLQLESRLDPTAINPSSGAIGIAQWLGSRKTKLVEFAKQNQQPTTNLGLQLSYLDHEVQSNYQTTKEIFSMTQTHKAAYRWLMVYEGMSRNPEQWYLSQRYAYADHWYAILNTHDPISKNALENANQGSFIDQLSCSSEASSASQDIVKVAKSMKGWFYYIQKHPSADLGSDLSRPNRSGGTDCSGFVWLVLDQAGYRTPTNMGWYTATMAQDARSSQLWLKKLDKNNAQAGDLVIVNQGTGAGNNGHTAILLENWHGQSTKIIEEGGIASHVNESTFGVAFSSLLKNGAFTLARPIKK